MTVKELILRAEKLARDNSSTILTALGVSGTVTTAYLAAKATFTVGYHTSVNDEAGVKNPSAKEYAKTYWKLYIPAAVSGAVTVTCIIGAAKINARRTAALTAAYSLSERAYAEYKDKVIETLGEKKERKVRDDIAEARVRDNPPPDSGVLLAGSGDVLCLELWTGRYFQSDMETLRRAVNEVNARILRNDEARLNDLYHILGLQSTSVSEYSGWRSPRLLEIRPSAHLHDGKPCLAFEYNYVDTF